MEIAMPNTLLIETNDRDQDMTLRHQLMELSVLALIFAPWALIAMALTALHLMAMNPAMLFTCMAAITVSIPGFLHFIIPEQNVNQVITEKVC